MSQRTPHLDHQAVQLIRHRDLHLLAPMGRAMPPNMEKNGKQLWENYGGIMIYQYVITIYTIYVFKPIMQHLQSPCLDKTPWVSKAPSIFIDSNTHKIWPLVNLSPTWTEEGNLVGAKSMTQLWPNHVVNQKWIWMNLACDLLANFLLSP